MGRDYSTKHSNNKNALIGKVFRGEDLTNSIFNKLNLRGANFSGQDLAGSSFVDCNIQGTIFRNATLKDCNFQGAIAGGSVFSTFAKIFSMLSINMLLIVLLQIIGQRSFLKFSADSNNVPETLAENLFVLFVIFIIVAVFSSSSRKSLKNAFEMTAVSIVANFVLIFSISVIKFIIGSIHQDTLSSTLSNINSFASRGSVGIVTGIGVSLLSVAMATSITIIGVTYSAKKISFLILLIDLSLMMLMVKYQLEINTHITTILFSILITLFGIINSFYFTIQALKDSNELTSIFILALSMASWDTTNFQGADLSNANFNFAILKNTNFRNSERQATSIDHISWYKAKHIDLALFGDNYLRYSHVRKLLTEREIKGNETDFIFDGLDLAGINLDFTCGQQTQLEGASFFRTNLSNADLEKANLKQANLKQANLDGANLNLVNLTGACIEDWGITRSTKINDILCEHIYTHLRADNPYSGRYRIPREEEGSFEINGFELYINSILDTLEVYHKNKINIGVVIQVLKEITKENYNLEIEIVGYDNRGSGQSTLRLKTNGKIDLDKLADLYYFKHEKFLPSRNPTGENSGNYLQSLTFINGNVNNIQGNNIHAIQGDNNQAILGDGNIFSKTIEMNVEIIENLTQVDILQLLSELELWIKKAKICTDAKVDLEEDISALKTAINRQEPNKSRALERLNCIAKTLEKTSNYIDTDQKIWTAVKSILVEIATWLASDASFQ
jgi:uncharacterized protein YjbI with pentapeptide repeats